MLENLAGLVCLVIQDIVPVRQPCEVAKHALLNCRAVSLGSVGLR
jgi:hypothetical protein